MDPDLIRDFSRMAFKLQKVKLSNLFPNLHVREALTLLKISEYLENGDQACFYEELQTQLAVTKSAISQMVSSLEDKGYVARKIDPVDRRKFVLSVTDKGRELVDEVRDVLGTVIRQTITKFGEENTREFIRLFDLFADALEEVKEEMQSNMGIRNIVSERND